MSTSKRDAQDLLTLQDLGRASAQVVHDLKNQLNGLKLYATFLRKRMETGKRPEDELEAVAKLIAGLDRTAEELAALVRYGRPLELRKQPGYPLDKILSSLRLGDSASDKFQLDFDGVSITGDFDPVALAEALKSITEGAHSMRRNGSPLRIGRRHADQSSPRRVVIEWNNIKTADRDVFHSFAGRYGLRMALAAKVIEAHDGFVEQQDDALCVSLLIDEPDN
jgi:signal transduction histidine kinase